MTSYACFSAVASRLFNNDDVDVFLVVVSGSCRITVSGSNLNVSQTVKFLMTSSVDSFALNVMFA